MLFFVEFGGMRILYYKLVKHWVCWMDREGDDEGCSDACSPGNIGGFGMCVEYSCMVV